MRLIRGIAAIAGDVGRAVRREINYHRLKPITATIFLTYRCDSRCATCTMWRRTSKVDPARELGIEEWIKVARELEENGIKNVEIFGGNVLLRKDVLVPLLHHLGERGFIIHLPTNQIGLDDETARTIAECCHMVYISTDGVGEVQDRIRGRDGSFKRVENSVAMLRKYRRNGRPQIVCNTTVSKYNFSEIERIAEQAVSNGFDQLHFEYVGEFSPELIDASRIDGLKPEPYYVKRKESVLLDRKQSASVKQRIRDIKKRYGRSIFIYSTNMDVLSEQNLAEGTVPNKKCYVARNEVTIDPYGNLVACLFINNYILGNIMENNLMEIQKNERHRRFMTLRDRGEIKMCSHCVLGVQRNPTFMKTLYRIYLNRIKRY